MVYLDNTGDFGRFFFFGVGIQWTQKTGGKVKRMPGSVREMAVFVST